MYYNIFIYRAKTRFAKFFNLPELIALFKESADIQTPDMLKLPVPFLCLLPYLKCLFDTGCRFGSFIVRQHIIDKALV